MLDWWEENAAQHANDPYWAEIWASALAVAQVIAADSSLVKGKSIAELGSGLGVAGLAAAKQGSFLSVPFSSDISAMPIWIPVWCVNNYLRGC